MKRQGEAVPRKLDLITVLYQRTLYGLPQNGDTWRAFLRTAAYQYKYSFIDQVLIYAQKPAATACAELDIWNQHFGRWVNRGANGIALIADENGRQLLRYVFDIKDTHHRENKEFRLWELKPEMHLDVITALKNRFAENVNAREDTLVNAVINAVSNLSEDNLADYLVDLKNSSGGSMLEEYDEDYLRVRFLGLIQASAIYSVLIRLGLRVQDYIDRGAFSGIHEFNTPVVINCLGQATADISEICLREIERTVKSYEKNAIRTFDELNERRYNEDAQNKNDEKGGVGNESDLYHEEGNQLFGSDADGTNLEKSGGDRAGGLPRKIRDDAAGIPEKAPQGNLRDSSLTRHADGASARNRAEREEANIAEHIPNGNEPWYNRGTEEEKPDDVDRADELSQSGSGGGDTLQSDSRVKQEGSFVDPDAIIQILRHGDYLTHSKEDIVSFLSGNASREQKTEYIKGCYPEHTVSFYREGTTEPLGYTKQEDNLIIFLGNYPNPTAELKFDWEFTENLIEALISDRNYLDELKSEQKITPVDLTLETLSADNKSAQFRISQEVIDEFLRIGGCTRESAQRIYGFYRRAKDLDENIAFLKSEYETDSVGLIIGERKAAASWDSEGVRITEGEKVFGFDNTFFLSWESVDKRIRELIEMGQYIPRHEAEKADGIWDTFVANKIADLYRDYFINIPAEYKTEGRFIWPDITQFYVDILSDREKLEPFVGQIKANIDRLKEYPPYFKNYFTPEYVLMLTESFLRELICFPKTEEYELSYNQFITQDKIERYLISHGSGMHGGKKRICRFFTETSDLLEKAKFLQKEFGIGGTSRSRLKTSHDSKGLMISAGLYDWNKGVLLKWPQAVKLIDKLIDEDRYFTEKEKEELGSDLKPPLLIASTEEQFESTTKTIAQPLEKTENTSVLDYKLHLGAKVFIGQKEYQINSLDGDTVELFDGTLIPLEMQKDIFLRQIKENPLNVYLKAAIKLEEENQKKIFVDKIHILASDKEIENGSEEEFFVSPPQAIDITYGQSQGEAAEKTTTEEKISEIRIPVMQEEKPIPNKKAFCFHPEVSDGEKHNFRIQNDNLGIGGAKEKFYRNIEAIKLLYLLESENRLATPEEQKNLCEYTGWGGLADAFDESKDNWTKECNELKSLMTLEEYTAARESTLTAFYTPPVVIKAIYKVLGNMGFKRGNVLEPSCGVGNFIGMLPESMDESKFYGVELDSISGRIARQLYQKSSITIVGYENTVFPDSFFDVAVGNVPFGQFKISDKKYDKYNFLIHDFFFAKTLDKVRPGGVIAFITSKGTLDKENPAVRKYIAQRADLIGAIRLPDTAFKANAGTEAVADIIFLQKRDRIVEIEPEWVHLGTNEKGIAINQYFIDNPDMIMGEMVMRSGPFGKESSCREYEGQNLSEMLDDAIANIHAEVAEVEAAELDEADGSIPADPSVKNFSFTLVEGKVYYRNNSVMNPVETSVTGENRIKGMIAIRDTVRDLIDAQIKDYSDSSIKQLQKILNSQYDSFINKYGLINSRANETVFSDDNSYFLLCSLEILDEEKQLKTKADMFTKRTIKPYTKVDRVDTSGEALAVSISERAHVDLDYMSYLTGFDREKLIHDLEGVIFRNVVFDTGSISADIESFVFVTADEYLSGNVREKLKMVNAIKAVVSKDEYAKIAPNKTALEAVQPEDLTAAEIGVRLGSTWIPQETVQQFVYELIVTPFWAKYRIMVKYVPVTAQWLITDKACDRANVKASSVYGTSRLNAYNIIEDTLNLKDVRIFDYVEDENGNKKPVLNKKETTIAQGKQEQIKRAFEDWIWKDPVRREQLCKIYNEKFNSIRPREYDGSHIRYSGINPEITLRKHQSDAVARIIYGGNSLFAHVVGAGKSATRS